MNVTESIVWSTESVEQPQALNYWRDVVAKLLYEVDITPSANRFFGRLEQAPLGPSLLTQLCTGPQSVYRSRSCIARSEHIPSFELIQVRLGRMTVRQNGQKSDLLAGDCVLVDRAKPFESSNTQLKGIMLSLPASWLGRWCADPGMLVGRRIAANVGWGRALSAVLSQIDLDTLDEIAVSRSIVADQVAALLVIAAGPDSPTTSRHNRKMLERASDGLRDLAHDPELSPTTLATSLGISKRYLHQLFAQVGSTFGRELLEIRLRRAHAMLVDRHFTAVPVGEIAFRCGFLDPGHFSKKFRSRFGGSATSLRAAVHSASKSTAL
jgi:AraC-like DNA-binding protein